MADKGGCGGALFGGPAYLVIPGGVSGGHSTRLGLSHPPEVILLTTTRISVSHHSSLLKLCLTPELFLSEL